MKLLVIGLGQCGSRVADEFVRLNKMAKSHRRTTIVTGAYAVNTDQADLTGLQYIGSDYLHRILIGGRKTWGHGVGKVNEMGAELAREDGDKVIDAIKTAPEFYQTHAFLLSCRRCRRHRFRCHIRHRPDDKGTLCGQSRYMPCLYCPLNMKK